jgi:hypothetical protein
LSLIRYVVLVLGIATASFAVAWGVALRRADAPTRWAAAFGTALALVNTITAHALVRWSSGRSTRAFLGAVLGGMAGRMALMLAAVVLAILRLDLPSLPLVGSLLSYFVVFLVLEIAILHRHTGMGATVTGVRALAGAGKGER